MNIFKSEREIAPFLFLSLYSRHCCSDLDKGTIYNKFVVYLFVKFFLFCFCSLMHKYLLNFISLFLFCLCTEDSSGCSFKTHGVRLKGFVFDKLNSFVMFRMFLYTRLLDIELLMCITYLFVNTCCRGYLST